MKNYFKFIFDRTIKKNYFNVFKKNIFDMIMGTWHILIKIFFDLVVFFRKVYVLTIDFVFFYTICVTVVFGV